MTELTYTVQVPVKVTAEDIYNILWSAVNQGSRYWLEDIKDVSGSDTCLEYVIQPENTSVFIYPETDDGSKLGKAPLTLAKLLGGLEQYLTERGTGIEDGGIDTSALDSYECDLILQYALFGEQVFG